MRNTDSIEDVHRKPFPDAPSGTVDLDSVISTSDLNRRPARPPDHVAENHALIGLAKAMAASPDDILHQLAETAMRLCYAHSGGISLLREDKKSFYWPAVAGRWAAHRGGGTPREFGPCGTVLDRGTAALFSHPERHFPYLAEVTPGIDEALLLPFFVGGEAVGTIWVIAHDGSCRFDAEDLRLMTSLSNFASGAYQTWRSLDAKSQAHRELQQAASALARSEEYQRVLFRSIPVAVLVCDRDSAVQSYNRRAVELWGREPHGGLELPQAQSHLADVLRTGLPATDVEAVIERPDGTHLAVVANFSALKDADGTIVGAIASFEDVSARKRSESLQAGQRRVLELMAQDAPLSEVLTSLVATIEGQSPSGLLGSILLLDGDGAHLRHGAAPSLPHAYNEGVDGIAIGPVAGSCGTAAFLKQPVRVSDIAGDPLWADFRDLAATHGLKACWSTPILSRGGAVMGTFAMYYRDAGPPSEEDLRLVELTTRTAAIAIEHKRAEQALRESEARFRNMADNAPVMIWITDPSGSCTYLNSQWYRFTGLSAETGLDLGWVEAIHSADRDRAEETFLAANERKESFRLEYRLRRSDGEYRWAIDSAAPRFGPAGEFLGYIGSVIDIHERRQTEERLRQSAKMEAIGRLAGGLAHDFNNQLHALSGFADFVARDAGLSGRSRHDLLEIQKSAERMASLTRQLLAFSRQQVLVPDTLDLNDAMRDTQAMLRRLLGSDIDTLLRASPDPIWVRVDRGQLLQVLMNLAINARDAMPDGGELAFDTADREVGVGELDAVAGTPVAPGRYAVLVVTDSGTGIAPEHLPHLFEPFFTTKEVGRGTGLGLATVHGIVTQSQGYIWPENAPGSGAKFTVLLPLADEPGLAPSRPDRQRAAATPRARILVVEDEDVVRAILVRTLEAEGYEVVQAREGKDALGQIERLSGAVDLVISDVVMPVMGGRELGERLAATWPKLPVVWMSGYPRDAAFSEGASRDDQPFLQKPVPGDLLVETVRRALETLARVRCGL
ncbi:MAG: PAS domain S-box protein [Gemmatimonadales bacterium]|nr:PAS domain S-box protein [Gemmatimonadales bacterium]